VASVEGLASRVPKPQPTAARSMAHLVTVLPAAFFQLLLEGDDLLQGNGVVPLLAL
jgi:hypothetical protein